MGLIDFLILAACICSVSFTISFTGIFKWLRDLLGKIHPKVHELIHCPWCLSHWITFVVLLLIWDWFPFTGWAVVDFLMTAFALTGVSGLGHYVLLRAYKPVQEAMLQRELDKLN